MITFHADESLVLVTFVGASTDKDVQSYLKAFLKVLKKREKHAAVVDLLKTDRMPESQRLIHKEWVLKNELLLAEYCVATALILSPLTSRLAVKTYLKLKPLPFPSDVFGSVSDGKKWAIKKLK